MRLARKSGVLGEEHPVSAITRSQLIATGDLNRDHRPDIVVVSSGRYVAGRSRVVVAVLLGRGNGSFRPARDYYLGAFTFGGPSAVAIHDVSGDHRPDIIVTVGTRIAVLLNLGHGIFGRERVSRGVAFDGQGDLGPLTTLAFGDINGDGRVDLVAGGEVSQNEPDGMLSVLVGRGNGTSGPATKFYGQRIPTAVALADLNRDGKLDLITQYAVTASDWDGGPLLHGGGHRARYRSRHVREAGRVRRPRRLGRVPFLAADFNHDGFLDLAMAVSGGLDVLLGNGDGTFQPPATLRGIATPASAVLGDFNGDGRPDVLVGQWSQGAMKAGVVFLNATAKPSGAGVANGASS